MNSKRKETPHLLSYSIADSFEAELFFYDHDLSERDLEKTSKGYACFYCDSWTTRTERWSSHVYLFNCEQCGWWQLINGGGAFGYKTCKVHRGLLKEFPIDSLDIELEELRLYLRKNPDHCRMVHPKSFERLVGYCIKNQLGNCEVRHVGGPSDRGVDLILVTSERGETMIQVKRRENLAKGEGVDVVRHLNGVLFRDNLTRGMVVTTASHFTKAAKEETNIRTPTSEVYSMELLSYADVVELFDVTPPEPYEPWEPFVPQPWEPNQQL